MDIFVLKEEEKALKIEEVKDLYRMDHNIPDTDGLLEMREEWGKKKEIRHNFYSFIRQTWFQKV